MSEEHSELVIYSLCLSAVNASGSCGWFLLAYVTKLGKRTCVLEHLRNIFFTSASLKPTEDSLYCVTGRIVGLRDDNFKWQGEDSRKD